MSILDKAIKGATASGLRRPIGSNPLEWEVTGIGSSAKLVEHWERTAKLETSRLRKVLPEAVSSVSSL